MFVTEELVKRACAAYDAYEDEESTDYPCEYPAMWHALTAALASMWRPIEEAPVGKEMFVAIGVTTGNAFTNGRPYTTDAWCVWQQDKGEFRRWPHYWAPTHFMPIPAPPAAVGGG